MTSPPDDLAPAPKLVWLILSYHGPLTAPELSDRFNLKKSTVYDSLDELSEYITSEVTHDSPSTRRYHLKSEYRTQAEV